ncbi:MAG: hypothetical protein ACPG85_05560, partial [Flavobacteriales bacterium]
HVTVEVPPEVKPESTEENGDAPEPTTEAADSAEPATVEVTLAEVLITELDNMAVAIRHPVVDGVLRHFREQMGEGHIPGLEDFASSENEVAELMADLAISEFGLSENWTKRHGIRPETEEQNLKEAMRGALLRLMLDEAHFEGARITRRLAEMAEDPSTSENPLEEEKDLLRRKMSVSSRVFKISEHFKTVILNPAKEDVAPSGSRP